VTAEGRKAAFVVFQAGGLRFAVEARHVAGMRAAAGCGSEGVLRLAGGESAPARLLELDDGRMLAAEEPVASWLVALAEVRPLPGVIAALIRRPEIRALLWDEAGPIVVVDVNRLGWGKREFKVPGLIPPRGNFAGPVTVG
jgi:hypothetical protein